MISEGPSKPGQPVRRSPPAPQRPLPPAGNRARAASPSPPRPTLRAPAPAPAPAAAPAPAPAPPRPSPPLRPRPRLAPPLRLRPRPSGPGPAPPLRLRPRPRRSTSAQRRARLSFEFWRAGGPVALSPAGMAVLRPFDKLPTLNSGVLLVGPAVTPLRSPALPSLLLPFPRPGPAVGSRLSRTLRRVGPCLRAARPRAEVGCPGAMCKFVAGRGLWLTALWPLPAARGLGRGAAAEAGGSDPPGEEGLQRQHVSGGERDAPPAAPGPYGARRHLVQEVQTSGCDAHSC